MSETRERLTQIKKQGGSTLAQYTYDSENRLTSATNADGTTAGPFNSAVDNMDLGSVKNLSHILFQ